MATDNHHRTQLFPDPVDVFDGSWTAGHLPVRGGDTSPPLPPSPAHPGYLAAPATDPTPPSVPDANTPPETGAIEPAMIEPEVIAPVVPAWVSAHLPAQPITAPASTRRFHRRTPPPTAAPVLDPATTAPAAAAAAVEDDPFEDGPDEDTAPHSAGRGRRRLPRGAVIAAAAATLAVAAAAVVVTVTSGDDTAADRGPTTAVASEDTPTTPDTPAASTPAALPPTAWCTATATADSVTTSAAGDRATPEGVIAAFEHAYYVQRSAAAVTDLMANPAPPDRIQSAIDRAPGGTEHCATIAATDVPEVRAVALALRTPSGSESTIASRITTTKVGDRYAIATIEELR